MSVKNEPRYPGNASLAYDRPPPIPERRRTPSPVSPGGYSSYDRYTSGRTPPGYRDGYGSSYRPDSWRPDRPYYNAPYGGPSPPDRYGPPLARTPDQDTWSRPSWRSPEGASWPERRPPQPSVYENNWPRPRRDTMAQPMFEPSENWKQTHGYSPEYREGSKDRDYDRHPDPILRDQSPDRSFRGNNSQSYSPSERFRRYPPAQDYRDSYTYSHARTDSYRPLVERSWDAPFYPGDYSPPYEPTTQRARSASFQRFPGPNRRRQRSISGGSVKDSIPSPIRTRTNLPDRVQYAAKSPSSYAPDASRKQLDSYTVSPVSPTKSISRSSSHSTHFNHIEPTDATAALKEQSGPDKMDTAPLSVERDTTHMPGAVQTADMHVDEVKNTATASEMDGVSYESAATILTETSTALECQQQSDVAAPHTSQAILFTNSAVVATPSIPINDNETPQEGSPEPDIPLAVQHPMGSVSHPPSLVEDSSFGEKAVGAIIPREESPPGEPVPLSEALRMVVAMRLQCDRQTQEERVGPILQDNLSKVVVSSPYLSNTSPDAVVEEVTSDERIKTREASFNVAKTSLEVRFAQRQADLSEKVLQLKEDYLTLHERWLVQCSKLDDVARAIALQEAAATAGRTTRRSAASMGDAVRSDLEMEQIIASLGNEELTDANHLGAKNAAKIPDMISVTTGEVEYYYDDTNNEVENPSQFYTPHTHMEDWTDEEITTLVEKFAEFPKQFGIIADHIPEKTPAECVAFYYLHKHKHIDFRKVVARRAASKRRRGGRKQKSNALLADILKHDDEVHAGSSSTRRKTGSTSGETRKGRRGAGTDKQPPTETSTPEPDAAEGRKRKRRATAKAAASAEQEETNEEGDADPKPAKRTRRTRKPRASASATPVGTPGIPDEAFGSGLLGTKFIDQTETTSKKKTASSNWSDEDKALFMRLLAQYGDDFKRIASSMPNKTTIQVSSFYKANSLSMGLEAIARGAPKRSPSPGNESWTGSMLPGSGVVTPSISSASTPAESYPPMNYNGYPFDAHYRLNGPTTSSYGPYSMSYPQVSNPDGHSQFYAPTAESLRAQYPMSADVQARGYVYHTPEDRFANPSHLVASPGIDTTGSMSLPGLSSRPFSLGQITYQPPSAAPATFRTAFRSTFPYSSLSPASFASRDSGLRTTNMRVSHTSNGEASIIPPGEGIIQGPQNILTFDTPSSFVHPAQGWATSSASAAEDITGYLAHRTNPSGMQ